MRSLKSGLIGCAVAALLGTFAVVGCSANGETGDVEPTAEKSPTEGTGNTLPPASNTDDDDDDDSAGKPDAGKKDAGKDAGKDAAKDSGPTSPSPGDACTTVNQKFKRACGKCGQQEAICEASKKVSDYGPCTNEIGLCEPGSSQACGNCGTQTCSNTCNWGTCGGQPANSCSPGSVDYTTATCSVPQTYREAVCTATCAWGNYSTTCAAPNNPLKLNISASVNGTVSGNYTLAANHQGPKSPSYCPGSASTATNYPYEIVEVKNTTGQSAKISAWLSGATEIDTVLTAYATNLPPNGTTIGNCATGNDECPSGLPCSGESWSGLTGTQAVTIAPGQVVLLRFSSYYASGGSYVTTGPVTLTVRTDSFN